jgi:histone chaperone ASF1
MVRYFVHIMSNSYRDSEESAPAEFPPEQPEADLANDDEEAYAAEELAEEQAVIADEENKMETDDVDMAGAEGTKGDDAASEAGSEDLEAESSESDDDDEEGDDEPQEAEGDGMDMDMTDAHEHPAAGASGSTVMAH